MSRIHARTALRTFTLLAVPLAVMTACGEDTPVSTASYQPASIYPAVESGAPRSRGRDGDALLKASELSIATVQVGADEPPQARVLYFDTDQAAVHPADMNLLQQHAAFLLGHPHYTLVIAGHADERGPSTYNTQLSLRRAKEVTAALIGLGVPEAQLQTQGFGEDQPARDKASWDENRRAELSYSSPNLASAQ